MKKWAPRCIFPSPHLTKADVYFLQTARLAASLSKDPSTKVGSVITRTGEAVATGYNGFPRGVEDNPEWYKDRERKLLLTEHSEINAILSAGRSGCSVTGCTLYCTHFSCTECAKHIIQAGITRFVYIEDLEFQKRWNTEPAFELFKMAGVEIHPVNKADFDQSIEAYNFIPTKYGIKDEIPRRRSK